ncbi:hypothetical protein BSLA_02f4104 [Burkholderia stabilis]|nr:hypothetical protein BSLA_02f4104 [Burkholderia stabilis]
MPQGPGRVARHREAGDCRPARSRSEGVLLNGFACANATANSVDPEFRIRDPDLRMRVSAAIDTLAGRHGKPMHPS